MREQPNTRSRRESSRPERAPSVRFATFVLRSTGLQQSAARRGPRAECNALRDGPARRRFGLSLSGGLVSLTSLAARGPGAKEISDTNPPDRESPIQRIMV